MKLPVPYYSQYLDINDPFWMLRACGAASLKMIAEYHGVFTPDMTSLCVEARDRGGYDMVNGWVHEYLLTKAKELGLQAERKEGLTSIDDIVAAIAAGNPVIVSVEKRVLEQTRFHMIVIVGFTEGEFLYHEPESTDRDRGAYRSCDTDTFMNYWRGKAIFITK